MSITKYVLKTGLSSFIGIDSSSGYPYETRIDQAKKWDEPFQPMEWLGSMRQQYPSARTVKLEYVITEVDEKELASSIRVQALKKLTDQEKKALGLC